MIDLHFHVLPGIDDGPADMSAAVALVEAAAAAGTATIVATSHVNWEWPNGAQTIGDGVRRVRHQLAERSIPVRIIPGAEIALTRAFELSDGELRNLRLGAGPWILVEAPHARGVTSVESMLVRLQERGQRIVLAHVERCPAFNEDAELLRRLVSGGMLASITASSLVGRFGRNIQRTALEFIAEGLIHNVASDAHDVRTRRPGCLRPLEEAGLAAQASWLTQGVPEAILRGTPIPPAPQWPALTPVRRPLFQRRLR